MARNKSSEYDLAFDATVQAMTWTDSGNLLGKHVDVTAMQ